MNEVRPPVEVKSLARVMQAIFERGDVPHKQLVKLRRRTLQLHRIQHALPADTLEPEWIAFAFLSFLEAGVSVARCLAMFQADVMARARLAKDELGERTP